MEKDEIWSKYEDACIAHSKMCWNMLLAVAALFISTVLSDSGEVKKMLEDMSIWFFIGYFTLISGFVYSYTSYIDKVKYWHDKYVLFDGSEKSSIAENKRETRSLYMKFFIQLISILVSYILLFVTLSCKYIEISDLNTKCNLKIIVIGSIFILNFPWICWILKVIFLVVKWKVEDTIGGTTGTGF